MKMYQIKQLDDHKYSLYELTNARADSWLKVAPERGGIITSFGVEDEEIFFLNKETFYDSDVNVRGGNPILFPISGQLKNGKYEWDGIEYKMKNHGFARNLSWEVVETQTTETDGASITLKLTSSKETKQSYPFDFEVFFTYVLKNNTLNIHQEYVNKSDKEMPIYPGFHPYFKTADKNLNYKTDAQTYLDYNDGKIKKVSDGIDLSDKKESVVLLDGIKKEIAFELPKLNKKIHMTYGEEFAYVYLWTEEGQDFVCVEPWVAKTDELNRKEELIFVHPGESLKTVLTIAVK
ncbi:aldose epimerase [Jeotgalibacillus proteolyticus]|uniref:Aldose epimerase n=2 Tax=Jeotgalibacillus proteolyticus TaxID=2082395 RepID=A0A2S5G899_9BACL|nr:aldose epimerase [Jeotgalibacillus proteolyticus]